MHSKRENLESVPQWKSTHENMQSPPKSEQQIIQGMIDEHIERLCKKLCYGNRLLYQCTVDKRQQQPIRSAVLCDWGNASYEWVLSELLYLRQLNETNNRRIIHIENYYQKILHSTSLWERYKNWRFRRRLRVPNYIKVIDPDAQKIFWWLHDQDTINNIAQRLKREVAEIRLLVSDIRRELDSRNRGYLLTQDKEVSLENLDPIDFVATPLSQQPEELNQLHIKIKAAFNQLSWLEQFVLDTMIIDNLKANSVLTALKAQSVSINEKIPYQEMNAQHIYYFLRKTLAKLKQLSEIHNEH